MSPSAVARSRLGGMSDVAPWYIVPANHKWYRDLAVADVLVKTLQGYRAAWRAALKELSEKRLAQLRVARAKEK